MLGNKNLRYPWVMSLALLLVALCFAGTKLQANDNSGGNKAKQGVDKDKSKKAPQAEATAVDPSQYVGEETCKTCHEEAAKGYDKGPHWKTALDKRHGPEWQGCESCHGPGKAHAESADPEKIVRFGGLSREESSKRCLSCHEFGEEHSNFLRSQHLKNNVGCVDCHSVHNAKVNRQLLKAAQPALCYTCHQEVKPDFSKPSTIA